MEGIDLAKYAPKGLDFDACSCNGRKGVDAAQDLPDHPLWAGHDVPPSRTCEEGLLTYCADINLPLTGPILHSGALRHLLPDEQKTFVRVTLTLFSNGIHIKPVEGWRPTTSIAWSPFSLVQACRLHSPQADDALPWLRLFKVSVFQHGATHFFAVEGDNADEARARWVAELARSLRALTKSLYPPYFLRVEPLPGAGWTSTRLLAGYLLLCDDKGVSLVYAELHAHGGGSATFAAYEDEFCDTQVVRVPIDVQTCVSERVGIDCSCFSFDGYHFSTRTCAEKVLWLRAIGNVKVKLRHRAPNPTVTELRHYRSAIIEYAQHLKLPSGKCSGRTLLPRRTRFSMHEGNYVPSREEEPEGGGVVAQASSGVMDGPKAPHNFPCAEVSVPMAVRPEEPLLEAPEEAVPITTHLGGGGDGGPRTGAGIGVVVGGPCASGEGALLPAIPLAVAAKAEMRAPLERQDPPPPLSDSDSDSDAAAAEAPQGADGPPPKADSAGAAKGFSQRLPAEDTCHAVTTVMMHRNAGSDPCFAGDLTAVPPPQGGEAPAAMAHTFDAPDLVDAQGVVAAGQVECQERRDGGLMLPASVCPKRRLQGM